MKNCLLHNSWPTGSKFKTAIVAAIRRARSVDIAVSYLQMSGWFILQRDLGTIPPNLVRIITTDQMNVTQPAVLREAFRLGMQIKCYCGTRVFHPKVFICHGVNKSNNLAILGSANISASGLQDGIEAGIRISEPLFFARLARWFEKLFHDAAACPIDGQFIQEYEKRWKASAKSRVQIRRISKRRGAPVALATLEDAETLDEVLSSIRLPLATLGFDQAANNIRNLRRLLDVLSRYPQLGYKEKSELSLLGFMQDGTLSPLGTEASHLPTAAAAELWCAWVKETPDETLDAVNARLISFKRAANLFWRLKGTVRRHFLNNIGNRDERTTLQAIELCCNGSVVVESLSLSDFKAIAPFLLSGVGLSEFLKHAITAYFTNKGARSWENDDRRIVLCAWGTPKDTENGDD